MKESYTAQNSPPRPPHHSMQNKELSQQRKKIFTVPGGSAGKASVYNAGDPGSIPGSGRSPGEGNGNPLQFQGQRSLVGYSPRGCKESDTTERLIYHI